MFFRNISPRPARQEESAHTYGVLLLLFASVIVMAGYRLNDCRFWIDETFSILIAQRPLSEIWSMQPHHESFYWNTFPPLYETLLHFVWHPSGERELAARGLSIVFSVIALLGIFRIAKLLYGTQTALIASTLAAYNYIYLFYAKMIRGYAVFNLLSVWSFYIFFTLYHRKKLSLRPAVMLVALNTALLYVSYIGVLVIILEFLFSLIIFRKKFLKLFWIIALLPFVLFLPWAEHFLEDIVKEPGFGIHSEIPISFWKIIASRLNQGVFKSLSLTYAYIGLFSLGSVSAIIKFWRKRGGDQEKATLLLASIVIIALISITWSTRSQVAAFDPNRARYYLPFLFPLFILTGFILRRLPVLIKAGAMAFFLFLSMAVIFAFLRTPREYYWPEGIYVAAEEIQEFPFPPQNRIAIEINEGVVVPPFMYAMFGPRFFYETSIPYHGANLDRFFYFGDNEYAVFCNYGRKIYLVSANYLNRFDWLCLIESKRWPVTPLERLYQKRLRDKGLENAIRLVAKKEWPPDKALYIYKIVALPDADNIPSF